MNQEVKETNRERKATIPELRQRALDHYEKASKLANNWYVTIPLAIRLWYDLREAGIDDPFSVVPEKDQFPSEPMEDPAQTILDYLSGDDSRVLSSLKDTKAWLTSDMDKYYGSQTMISQVREINSQIRDLEKKIKQNTLL